MNWIFWAIAFLLSCFWGVIPHLIEKNLTDAIDGIPGGVKSKEGIGGVRKWIYILSLVITSISCLITVHSSVGWEREIKRMEHRVDSLETVSSAQRDTIDLFRIVIEYNGTENTK